MRKPSLSSSSSSSSSSSKQAHVSRTNNKVVKQEPRLSGAYIRSLVKHLTTSVKSKDHCNNKFPETLNSSMQPQPQHRQQPQPQPQPQPQHKKQVRKRQHTSKPYQERLLNMAEARREIVTALKFHRASMKQRQTTTANNHRQPDQSLSSVTSHNSYLEHYSSSSSQPVPHFWPISLNTPPPLPKFAHENLDFTLPIQTLGLNLNFQDFKNLDSNCYHNSLSIYSPSSSASSSSSSSSAAVSFPIEETVAVPEVVVVANTTTTSSATTTPSSAVVSLTTTDETAAMSEDVVAEEVVIVSNTTTSSGTTASSSSTYDGLHHAMDEEGMEEIRSIGEQHQMEWDDKVSLMTSARWFEFLKTFEME